MNDLKIYEELAFLKAGFVQLLLTKCEEYKEKSYPEVCAERDYWKALQEKTLREFNDYQQLMEG